MAATDTERIVPQIHVDTIGEVHTIRIPESVAVFIARLQALARDPNSTLRQVEMLFYGPENPILDHEARPGRHLVTAETLKSPAYLVMHDIVQSKRLAELEGARPGSGFSSAEPKGEGDEYLYLTEAYEKYGIPIPTIRRALQEQRIRGHKNGKSWRVLVADLDKLRPRKKSNG